MTKAVELAQVASTGVSEAFKNRIINGAMVIDQRNAGASVTQTTANVNTYTLDRWRFYGNAGTNKFTVQQNAGSVTPPVGFTNYLGVTSLTANSPAATDEYIIAQSIEGYNVSDFNWGTANAQTVTLSFWVRSSLTGNNFGAVIRNGSSNRHYPFNFSVSSANTWEQKSVTIAGDTTGSWATTNGTGLVLSFNLGTGSTYLAGSSGAWTSTFTNAPTGSLNILGTNGATFYITGVQLEVGSTATSFDYRPYTTELQLCQRYYQQITGAAGGNGYYGIGTGNVYISTTADILAPLPVTMRTVPTTSFSGTVYLYDASGNPAITSIAATYGGQSNIYMQLVGSGGGLTTGRGVYLYTNNQTSSIFRFSSEL